MRGRVSGWVVRKVGGWVGKGRTTPARLNLREASPPPTERMTPTACSRSMPIRL